MNDDREISGLESASSGPETPLTLPDELPILPLRDTVLYPHSFMPLAVARESSVQLIDDAIAGGKLIGVFTQRDATVEEPVQDDLHLVGTVSHIHKMFKLPDGSLRLIVQGLGRVQLDRRHRDQALSAWPRVGRVRGVAGRWTASRSTR